MKKSVIFLGAAVLALLACNKTTIVDTTSPQEITFKTIANVPTKAHKGIGDGLNGTNLNDKDYLMYVSAAQLNTNNFTENGKFMVNEPFRYDAGSGTWRHVTYASRYSDTPVFSPIYWPVGGAKLNILATATPKGPDFIMDFVNVESSTSGLPLLSGFRSFSIDQADELVACAYQQTYAATINLTFDHIYSLLIFNVSDVNNVGNIVVEDIGFYSDVYLENRRLGRSLGVNSLAEGDYDVFTSGVVKAKAGSTKVSLQWDLRKGGDYAYSSPGISWPSIMIAEDTDFSDCNPGVTAGMHYDSVNDRYDPITDTKIEFGHVLIAPQPKQAMTIRYRILANGDTDTEDVFMDYTYPLTGNWQAGKKYIYNISFNLSEITITPTVTDWVDGGEPDIDLS